MKLNLVGALNNIVGEILKANERAVRDIGDFLVVEFKDLAREEVYAAYHPSEYKRTFDFLDSPSITQISNRGVTVVFRDSGGWRSNGGMGDHFYAMYGLEGGYTWGRRPTNIMSSVVSTTFQRKIGERYLASMLTQGIPLKRK